MFHPFKYNVWIVLILIGIIFGVILRILLKRENINVGLGSSILLCYGAFCQQSFHKKIFSLPAQCLLLFLFISSYLIYNIYTSTLVSSFMETKPETNIQTKEDLAKSNIPIGFCNAETIRNFINVRQALRTFIIIN